MKFLKPIISGERRTLLLLLACSSVIYFFYFHHVLLHVNSLLSSITGDALKNYYTFAHHTRNDAAILHFSGMNFPYGEHVVYTDCQPVLTFLFRYLPFTHSYLIGILHTLLFGSFIITPLILFRVLRRLEMPQLPAFLFSLGITLLSPQFAKINGGHHGLAYGCVIPLAFLLFLRFTAKRSAGNLLMLFYYNTILFLLHPYLGFGVSLLSFLSLLILEIPRPPGKIMLHSMHAFIAGLLPIATFKLFMLLTDEHINRTNEPYGNEALVENPSSLLAPDFGPFMDYLNGLFPAKVIHFEGHSYLGLFTILLTAGYILSLPFIARKVRVKKEAFALFITCFILLLISFGLHTKLLSIMGISIASLNQFRAVCRFAWFFYHALPVFVVTSIYYSFNDVPGIGRNFLLMKVLPLLFFAVNLLEADAYFKKDNSAFWKFRNIFNEVSLTQEEKQLISKINSSHAQAIVPLPLFMLGSEMYDRVGGDNSLIPSVLLSFHTGLPIMSTWLSRTSMTETAEIIELLNSYKKNRQAVSRLNGREFLVIKTRDQILPDENRLAGHLSPFYRSDSLEISLITQDKFLRRKTDEKKIILAPAKDTVSRELVIIGKSTVQPFTEANFKDYQMIALVDSNAVEPGNYIVSLHYHYQRMNYRSLACDIIITRRQGEQYVWQHVLPMSVLSGFYPGFGVSERKLSIENGCRYEFLIKGNIDQTYHVSDFMLRPENTTVIQVTTRGDSIFNNFPP